MAKAVVFGYHDVGVRCLGALLDAGVEVPLVATHRDDPQERIWFAAVAELANSKGIDTVLEPDIGALLPRLRAMAPDFIFSFYYRRMLPPEVLASAKRGAYNMHGSLLPKYRGRSPVNWAVLMGETQTGATLHEMVAKPDAGRIVDQEAVPIGPDDTAVEVFRRVSAAAETVMRRSIGPLLAGKARLRPNDVTQGSYYGGRRVAAVRRIGEFRRRTAVSRRLLRPPADSSHANDRSLGARPQAGSLSGGGRMVRALRRW